LPSGAVVPTTLERVVEREEVELALPSDRDDVFGKLHAGPVSRPFRGGALARVVDEDAPHRLSGRREELGAALPRTRRGSASRR